MLIASFEFVRSRMLKFYFAAGGMTTVSWYYLFLRFGIGSGLATLLFLSQRFWYRSLWRVTAHWGRLSLRWAPRIAYVALLSLMVVTLIRVVVMGHSSFTHHTSWIAVLTGLWFFSALFAYLSVKTVHGLERIWHWSHAAAVKGAPEASPEAVQPRAASVSLEPTRR